MLNFGRQQQKTIILILIAVFIFAVGVHLLSSKEFPVLAWLMGRKEKLDIFPQSVKGDWQNQATALSYDLEPGAELSSFNEKNSAYPWLIPPLPAEQITPGPSPSH